MDINKLHTALIAHEGSRLFPYVDTTGHITIGVGHNLTAEGISPYVCQQLLTEDIDLAVARLAKLLPWTSALDDCRYRAFVELVFNLGANLMQFSKFLAAAQFGDWPLAIKELANSHWAEQVGHRAVDLQYQLLHGEDPPPGTVLAVA